MRVDNVIFDLRRSIEQVIRALNNNISFQDNIQSSTVTVLDTGAANTAFTVTHNLGKIPISYVANIDKNGTIYDYDRTTWTASTLQLKCSAANCKLNIVIF